MENENILDTVWDSHEEWTDEQIGEFVRRALCPGCGGTDIDLAEVS